jgi:hypothetical protein
MNLSVMTKCSTKPLFLLFTKISTVVKEKLHTYRDTTYARSGVNQMWILYNSKDLLANLKPQIICQINSIKTNDFSTLCTTLLVDFEFFY